MEHIFEISYEYEVTPKGDPQRNMSMGILPFRECDTITMKSTNVPTKTLIKGMIHKEWLTKRIDNRHILEVYTPELID